MPYPVDESQKPSEFNELGNEWMATPAVTSKKATMTEKVAELRAKRAEVELGGGKDRIQKQHQSGKLTARERVAKLVDRDSFDEIGMFACHRATYFGMAAKDLPADVGDFRLMSSRFLNALRQMRETHRFLRGMVSWIAPRTGCSCFAATIWTITPTGSAIIRSSCCAITRSSR